MIVGNGNDQHRRLGSNTNDWRATFPTDHLCGRPQTTANLGNQEIFISPRFFNLLMWGIPVIVADTELLLG
jgi:hypothetical protein